MKQKHRIETAITEKRLDAVGISTKNDIEEDLLIKGIESIRFCETYHIESNLEKETLSIICEKAIIDPLIQKFSIDENFYKDSNYWVEVKLHEGVTDNLGIVMAEAIEDFTGKKLEAKIRTGKKYYFYGKITKNDIKRITKELLANSVIETYEIGEKNE